MTQYYQLICKNGHQESFWHSLGNQSSIFCEKCGEITIDKCLHCNYPINGYYYPDGVITLGPDTFPIPSYCKDCGKPYPWTEKILNNAIELISLDDDLDSRTREIIKNAIPDLLVDTPTTPLAVAKYKININKASQIVKDGMRNLLVDVLSETAKKSLFG